MIKKIYKDVPIPPQKSRSSWSQLLSRMQDGDMVEVTKSQANAIRTIAYRYGHKIVTRSNGKKVRIWKVQ